jgi:hypothetical protein
MTYRKINWDKFNDFPKNKYFYGGPYIYFLETNDYPSYGYSYLTTSNPEDNFFTEVKLSVYD